MTTITSLEALEREQKALEPKWSRYELKHIMSMAGPIEEHGKRQPGERGKYESWTKQ